jgi:hypothetical protein
MHAHVMQTGGRNTAGLGGRGGFKRLYMKGHDIYQVGHFLSYAGNTLS